MTNTAETANCAESCYDCGARITSENESSGLEEGVEGEPVVVPLCEQCSSARDYRVGCR